MLCTPLSDAEIEANAALVAAELLAHPVALLLPDGVVVAYAGVACREGAAVSPRELRGLRRGLDLAAEVEIRMGLEVAA
ncbi:MAG TPA: hypothetical protein VGF29_04990 [Hyphomicrobiaceae bacterium]|jgi:hypothetical protein